MTFISMRRYFLDEVLKRECPHFTGKILDLGGVKHKRRGSFQIPENLLPNWICLNRDQRTNPEIMATLPNIPLTNEMIDTVIMTEVLEYIQDSQKMIEEIHRVLKKNGMLFLSVPFLHPLHGDPESDYYRSTETFYKFLFQGKFKVVTMERMGGVVAVVYDLIREFLSQSHNPIVVILAKGHRAMWKLWLLCDNWTNKNNRSVHTGFWFSLKKI